MPPSQPGPAPLNPRPLAGPYPSPEPLHLAPRPPATTPRNRPHPAQGAWQEHIVHPLLAVRNELFATFRERSSIVSPAEFEAEKQSLLRMLQVGRAGGAGWAGWAGGRVPMLPLLAAAAVL
jgi:hypothetical protein